jgi:integrase
MASISKEPNGHRSIQFRAVDGKRRTIRLGKVNQKTADALKIKVEALSAAALSAVSLDDETAKWLGNIPDDLAKKLAAVGLATGRNVQTKGLDDFIAAYIVGRSDVKPNTVRNLEAARRRLVEFFGANKNLGDITPADADAFLVYMRGEKYANATTGRTVKRAKQFFRAAVRKKIIRENPFENVKPPSQTNPSRKFFVTQQAVAAVLDACPDVEWRLIVALSRYGGLRCPSEIMAIKWSDVDWERDRLLVHAPKTEHHEDGGQRWVPLFPELRIVLEDAFDQAREGAVNVIEKHRLVTNLRTRFEKIVRRTGLTKWPKLFHNLRASRETELCETFPIHVVCAWLGNTAMIAAKHYLQVQDKDFARAAQPGAKSGARSVQNQVQQPAAASSMESQENEKNPENPGFLQQCAVSCGTMQGQSIPPRGLEPLS